MKFATSAFTRMPSRSFIFVDFAFWGRTFSALPQIRLALRDLQGGLSKCLAGSICLGMHIFSTPASAETAGPVADKVAYTVADNQDCQRPDAVQLTGMIGDRLHVNAINRPAAD